MTRPDPHPVLDYETADCLRLLADPELPDDVPLPDIARTQADALVRAANVHGTIATAYRHVKARGISGRLAAAFEQAEPLVFSAIGWSMRLRRWGERIASAFDDENVRCALVKGPVFADTLYPNQSDRFYTDVDIVIDADALPRAGDILSELGFSPDDIPNRDAAAHCEHKWTLNSERSVLAELQTNLIHSARLRRRMSVDLDAIQEAGRGDSKDATSLLFVAGVHAATGHQFERLELLVDVMQAVRGHAGPIDLERLRAVCLKSGTLRAVAASLALAGRMYEQGDCTVLAERLIASATPLEWRLVSPDVVLKAQSVAGRRVAWRRKLFRQLVSRPVSSVDRRTAGSLIE